MTDDIDECPNCGGTGKIGGCFEDTCVCDGHPEDPDFCCNPRAVEECTLKGQTYTECYRVIYRLKEPTP